MIAAIVKLLVILLAPGGFFYGGYLLGKKLSKRGDKVEMGDNVFDISIMRNKKTKEDKKEHR